ncbi:Retinol dehydrogenase 14 [Zancudomyces culisetae]|uniref:Retinol dehydrogenase 14 n=1 Tax=Zancudomyces culisetae TaxID=1213189 RepID=A0A1R1PTG7_ZANCU|nr:Retinol dehydrogenase 14 [Zancudomyces culisetae]|eukprot:OMH84260.1 Retinol dehydrogenase 14 [Zancudomyces culisetae]
MSDLEQIAVSTSEKVLLFFEGLNLHFAAAFILHAIELIYIILSKFRFGATTDQVKVDRLVLEYKTRQESLGNVRKVAIVTGANSGIGFETTKALVRAGFHVVMACRNRIFAGQAMEKLEQQTDLNNFEFMELDLASIKSVKSFTENFKAKFNRLDVLVNNAGVMACPYQETEDGIEAQFGVNYVGHFVLTNELLEVMQSTAEGSRIVNVSSIAHRVGIYETARILDKNLYNRVINYGISKLAFIMFTVELANRLGKDSKITVNALHPGVVDTNLPRYIPFSDSAFFKFIFSICSVSPVTGALNSIRLSLSSEVEGITGKYFEHECVSVPNAPARDKKLCSDLWGFTEAMVKGK